MATAIAKHKQLEKRIKELRKERAELGAHIQKLENSLQSWRRRLRKAENEYAITEKAYWKIIMAMRKRAEAKMK